MWRSGSILSIDWFYMSDLFLESKFFWKVNSRKVNYFMMFDSVMKNKLENIFQCFVML